MGANRQTAGLMWNGLPWVLVLAATVCNLTITEAVCVPCDTFLFLFPTFHRLVLWLLQHSAAATSAAVAASLPSGCQAPQGALGPAAAQGVQGVQGAGGQGRTTVKCAMLRECWP
jgi:hypothetical protein